MNTKFFKRMGLVLILFSLVSCISYERDFNVSILSKVEAENTWENGLPQTMVYNHVVDHFTQDNGKVKKALVIGLDGVRPDAAVKAGMIVEVEKILDNMKFYFSYAGGNPDDGTRQLTYTAPGWTTINTGQWAVVHGVKHNAAGNKNPNVKTFMQAVYDLDNTRKVASIAAWENITEYGTYGDENVYTYTPDGGYYTGDYPSKDPRVVAKTIELIKDDYACLFNVIDFTDHTGHKSGFSPYNDEYVSAIKRALAMSVDMINAAKERPEYASEDWLFIITTDHGGVNKDHGGQSLPERTTFIYTNKEIK